MWKHAAALLLAIVDFSFVQAADPVELKWKYEKGKTFYEEHTTQTKQSMKVMGTDIAQGVSQAFYFSWTPIEQDKDGNWLFKQKIEAIKIDLDLPGNKLNFDSTKKNAASNHLTDFFTPLVGAEFTATVSPEFKLIKLDGKEEFLKKLVAANQQMEPMMRQSLTDDTLKQMTDPALAVAPNKPVQIGETWTKTSRLGMGAIGTYDLTHKYTYEGIDDRDKDLARIKVDVALKYALPPEGTAPQVPFKVKKADLRKSEGRGTAWFDIVKGRLARSETEVKVEGKISIELAANLTEVDLNQSQKTIIKTADQNPVGK